MVFSIVSKALKISERNWVKFRNFLQVLPSYIQNPVFQGRYCCPRILYWAHQYIQAFLLFLFLTSTTLFAWDGHVPETILWLCALSKFFDRWFQHQVHNHLKILLDCFLVYWNLGQHLLLSGKHSQKSST